MSKDFFVNGCLEHDGYKTDHPNQYPEGAEFVHSNLTARNSKYATVPKNIHEDKIVFFGLSYYIQEYMIKSWNENFFDLPVEQVVEDFNIDNLCYVGPNNIGDKRIRELHAHGKLPLRIKALPEGSRVPIGVPPVIIESIGSNFFWVTNGIETYFSTTVWGPITSATTAHGYRSIIENYANQTGAGLDFVPIQGHDFSARGMFGREASLMSGAAHLLSFVGTDTRPAIGFLRQYYGAKRGEEVIGVSVPATEHAVACFSIENIRYSLETYGEWSGYKVDDLCSELNYQLMSELVFVKEMINRVYPSGMVSLVSDSFDYWGVIEKVLPAVKDDIMARDGKVVIRPDSGDPVRIVCGDDIEDYTDKCKDLDEAKKWSEDWLRDIAIESAEHGEIGDEFVSCIFIYDGNYYKSSASPEWNRHDKTYYYFDGFYNFNVEEYEPTPEEKGSVQCLWDIFGGTINEKGFKTLDPHIGLIYGDSINFQNCEAILKGLMKKGFASDNIVFGFGSFGYQMVTRDTYGMAVKATFGIVNGEARDIYKDPKTGSGKKSAKGLLAVLKDDNGEFILRQEIPLDEYFNGVDGDQMEVVFEDGEHLIKPTLKEIRNRLWDGFGDFSLG